MPDIPEPLYKVGTLFYPNYLSGSTYQIYSRNYDCHLESWFYSFVTDAGNLLMYSEFEAKSYLNEDTSRLDIDVLSRLNELHSNMTEAIKKVTDHVNKDHLLGK